MTYTDHFTTTPPADLPPWEPVTESWEELVDQRDRARDTAARFEGLLAATEHRTGVDAVRAAAAKWSDDPDDDEYEVHVWLHKFADQLERDH